MTTSERQIITRIELRASAVAAALDRDIVYAALDIRNSAADWRKAERRARHVAKHYATWEAGRIGCSAEYRFGLSARGQAPRNGFPQEW